MGKAPETVETGLEAEAQTPAPEPTTTAVGGAEVQMVEIPRDEYESAQEDNRQRNFVHAILDARKPDDRPPYVPPPVPKALADQTNAEIEAGRKRVAECEATEAERRAIIAAHKNDKWADKGSTPVFRPADYVPDPRKGQGNVGARQANV